MKGTKWEETMCPLRTHTAEKDSHLVAQEGNIMFQEKNKLPKSGM